MHALLTKPLDWCSIQLARLSVHNGHSESGRAAAADELLHCPDFFCDFVQVPRDLTFTRDRGFRFTSPIQSPWAKNDIVYGKLFPCREQWRPYPTVLLLHGWNAESSYRLLLPYLAWRLNRAGLNAAMIELPYHGHRKPHGRGAVTNFLSDDLLHVVGALRQALADTRSLVAWLREQGSPFVGIWGFSLGAWLGGMVACHDARIGAAVLTTPVSRIDSVIEQLDFCRSIRKRLKGSELRLGRLNLVSHRPKLRPNNILLVESEHDLFAPRETIEELWRTWDRPAIWRTRQGHISALMCAPVMERTVGWLKRSASGIDN
jgi:pimeloyl-ACP methyl ester carboxylesterase